MVVQQWAGALGSVETPVFSRVAPNSSLMMWHADVEFEPVNPQPGRILSDAETWNGKPLVSESRYETVAEAALVSRMRTAGWVAFWTGGQKRWFDLTLRASRVWQETVDKIDSQIRARNPALGKVRRGLPDIVAWSPGRSEFHCFEYKGPSCARPTKSDEIKIEQIAWFEAALALEVVNADRCAIVRWTPNAKARDLLERQAAAREGRSSRPGRLDINSVAYQDALRIADPAEVRRLLDDVAATEAGYNPELVLRVAELCSRLNGDGRRRNQSHITFRLQLVQQVAAKAFTGQGDKRARDSLMFELIRLAAAMSKAD